MDKACKQKNKALVSIVVCLEIAIHLLFVISEHRMWPRKWFWRGVRQTYDYRPHLLRNRMFLSILRSSHFIRLRRIELLISIEWVNECCNEIICYLHRIVLFEEGIA